jgi:hypothetical protein
MRRPILPAYFEKMLGVVIARALTAFLADQFLKQATGNAAPHKMLLAAIKGLLTDSQLSYDLAHRRAYFGLAMGKPNLLLRGMLPTHRSCSFHKMPGFKKTNIPLGSRDGEEIKTLIATAPSSLT